MIDKSNREILAIEIDISLTAARVVRTLEQLEEIHGLPKGEDLSIFSQLELDRIAWQLNTRPRKSLGYKCPAELFTPEAFDFKQHHAAIFALQP